MSHQRSGLVLRRTDLLLLLIVVLVAAIVRINHIYDYFRYFQVTYGLWDAPDRVGESYHRWLMEILTVRNGYVYSDFKPMPNLALVWLPLVQYLSIPVITITNNFSIWPERAVSLVVGAATCAIVYYTCRTIFGNPWHALVGGLLLAFQPWHVDFSLMGTAKVLVAFFISLEVLSYIKQNPRLFFTSSALGMLTSYEAWFTTAFLVVLGPRILAWAKPWPGRTLSLVTVPAIWMGWSAMNTGNPLAWIAEYLSDLGWSGKIDLSVSLFYFNVSLVMTLFIFFIAIAIGLVKNRESRLIASMCAVYTLYYSLAHVLALDPGDIARVVPILPLLVTCAAPFVPRPGHGVKRRALIGVFLVLVLFATYAFQIGIGPRKEYVIMPEYRSAMELAQRYRSGNVAVDSPLVAYYSGIDPAHFISFSPSMAEGNKLGGWLKDHDVSFLLWVNATFSLSPKLLPQLASAEVRDLGGVTLQPVYEESLKLRRTGSPHWEFDQPGTPDIILYEVIYSK